MTMGINYAVCNHIEDGSESICGAMATDYVEIIKDVIPPMPVCSKHVDLYTPEHVNEALASAFIEMVTEEDIDTLMNPEEEDGLSE